MTLLAFLAAACLSCSASGEGAEHNPNHRTAAEALPGIRTGPANFRYAQLLDRFRWVVSDDARVWRTDDGGISWTQCYTAESDSSLGWKIRGLSFVDREIGFLIDRSVLMRTSDGGLTWTRAGEIKSPDQSCLLENCYFAQSCCFSDPLNGWVVGLVHQSDYLIDPGLPAFVGLVLRTQDGGSTWARQKVSVPKGHINRTTRWALNDLFFEDRLFGWVVGDGAIFFTTDGGESWRASEIDRRNRSAIFKKVSFVDHLHGWVIMKDQDDLLYTTDGGKTWRTLRGPAEMLGLQAFDVAFITPEHGFAILRRLYETTDGALHWKEVRQPACDADRDFSFLGRARDGSLVTGCSSGSLPLFITSTNDGRTWPLNSRRLQNH